jgi:hypothetical protein
MTTDNQGRRPDGKRAYNGWQDGPTYAEAREQAAALEEETGLRVGFLLEPEDVGRRWRYSRMWVRGFLASDGPWKPGAIWAAVPLGGSSGARTQPAAMVQVMTELHQRWYDDLQQAEADLSPSGDEVQNTERSPLSYPHMG